MVITQRLWSESISRSSSETPGIFMASTMASTMLLSRPSEKLGTHSTSVDITGKNKGRPRAVQLDQTKNGRREITSTAFESGFQIVAYALPRILAHHQRTPTRRKRQSWKNSGSL